METYIRFQTQLNCGNTGRPAGIFVAAGRVEDRTTLPTETRKQIREVLDWVNENLTAPKLDNAGWKSLFWFRTDSQVLISRMWELVYWLNDEGIFVSKIRTKRPGTIIYQDEHQVAAIPYRKPKHRQPIPTNEAHCLLDSDKIPSVLD